MSSSRSRFYVDIPLGSEPPSQRHSMYVSHPEIHPNVQKQDASSASSSAATLPSAAGSVDRLTGLGSEKKTPRFFTLKPKTSFSLRPFFSSTSIANLSPSKSRRKSGRQETASRCDSYVQTDDNDGRVYGEVGVQTLNASTVDVPVQTCSSEWEEGDTLNFNRKSLFKPTFSSYGGYSPRWSSSSLSKPFGYVSNRSEAAKNSIVTPLDSSKLLKYTAPCDSTDSPSSAEKVEKPKSLDTASPSESLQSSSETPVTVRDASNNVVAEKCLENCSPESSKLKLDNPNSKKSISADIGEKINSENQTESSHGKIDTVAESKCDNSIQPAHQFNNPISVLKLEKTDSPKTKSKTVHFKLSEPITKEPDSKTDNEPQNVRNIDKEFEDLLRNLDILVDEPEKADTNILVNSPKPQSVKYISPDLKSALDVLKQDSLAPVLEVDLNSDEISERIPLETNSADVVSNSADVVLEKNANEENSNINITAAKNDDERKCTIPPTQVKKESENKLSNIKEEEDEESNPTTSPSKSYLDAKTNDNFKNVCDKVNTEEPVKTVFLPNLPHFFESAPESTNLLSAEIVSSSLELPTCGSSSLEENKEDTMLSRSSSRSSMRSNSRSDFEICLEKANKFDSCENLDQLEEEIIRSLYSPGLSDSESNSLKRTPHSKQVFEDPVSGATVVRRAILDRLLSGESVDQIMPTNANISTSEEQYGGPADVRRKVKQPNKYTATLFKFEDPQPTKFSDSDSFKNDSCSNSNLFENFDNISDNTKNDISNFTDTNSQNTELSTNKSSSFLSNDAFSFGDRDNTLSLNKEHDTNQSEKVSNDPANSMKCDFSNCIRPSNLKNSPFLNEINSKSSNLHQLNQSALINKTSNAIPTEADPSPKKANGQCDFASCLKPSQVQNSLFKAELSEITANKSLNVSQENLRANSPLITRINTPPPFKKDSPLASNNLKLENNIKNDSTDIQQHKSELTITLQPVSRYPSDTVTTVEEVKDIENPTTMSDLSTAECDGSDLVEPASAKELAGKESPVSSEVPTPPPPPPPLPSTAMDNQKSCWIKNNNSLESQIQERQSSLVKNAVRTMESKSPPKACVMAELENRFKDRIQVVPEQANNSVIIHNAIEDSDMVTCDLEVTEDNRSLNNKDTNERLSPLNINSYKIEKNSYVSQKPFNSALNGKSDERKESFQLNGKTNEHNYQNAKYSPNTFITDEPPPPGAVLIDKKVTVDGDKLHTDKLYALPVKEIIKETTSTTKYIPAPPKYEGIGPTEDGIPIGLRNSVKKENMHNWYKTMFKSLHKADSSNDSQEYIIGYSSEPESSKKDTMYQKKSSTLGSHSNNNNVDTKNYNRFGPGYPPSAKSSIETYNVRPRLIEDYEPGYSSVTDDEITTGSKRFLPTSNVPKPTYEFKNGYEQDNHFVKKLDQPDPPTIDQQKTWYKEIQIGGEVPQYGLAKPAPEKPKEPMVGPLPPPPLHYNGPLIAKEATRPADLPSNYSPNGSDVCQQMNGAYEFQMRQAIHTELHQRLSPSSSSQLSSPTRSILKSPCKTPDLKIPARALFDFRAESPKEVSLKKGDNVLILRQLDKNWYEGEKQGVIGIFPINYIEIVPPEHAFLSPSSMQGLGKVLYDFTAHTPVELTVKKHDTISLLRRVDSNWYEAEFQNKKGIVPVSYLQVLQEPIDRSTPLSSPTSCTISPGSRPTSREGILKTVSSPIPYNSSASNSTVVTDSLTKLQNRSKKSSNLIEPVMYKALYSYTPQNTDELELSEGDNIYVVEMCDDGWYVGTSVRTGIFGIFPGNYVEKV